MAKLIVDVMHQPTQHIRQIEFSIDDGVLSGQLQVLPEFISNELRKIDTELILIRFRVIAEEGISWQ